VCLSVGSLAASRTNWYHPITQCKLTGGFDADKNLTVLHMRISGQSILAKVRPEALQDGRDPATFSGLNPGGAESAIGYSIPNILIDHSMRNPHVQPVSLPQTQNG
jgi:isoquinoline 1-oxidoreductase subunit beta